MNAREALRWMENDTGIMSCNDEAWLIAIRVLRLLAAADEGKAQLDAAIDAARGKK